MSEEPSSWLEAAIGTLRIVFDTNVFRDIQRGRISEAQVHDAEAKLCEQGEGYLAALTLFELGSHIDDQEQQNYETFRDAFRAAARLCKRALPDPESFMCRHAFGLEPAWESICEEEILVIANLITSSDTYDDLTIPREAMLKGKRVTARFNRGFLRAFRESTEGDYVKDMYDVVARSAIPDYDERRALSSGPVRLVEGPDRKKFLDFLEGREMRDALVMSQSARLNLDWPAIPVSSEQVWERLHAFFSAYITILRDFLRDGYNAEKNKNDFNDVHFFSYLSDPQIVFVTQDNRAARKVSEDSVQKARVLSFENWLAR